MSESLKNLSPEHIDEHVVATLRMHAVDRKHPFGVHVTALMITVIILVGIGSIALTVIASRADAPAAESVSSITPTPLADPTPLPDPNTNLPAPIQAAIAAWPLNQPKTIIFSNGTAAPASTVESDAVYTAAATYAADHAEVTLYITAYAIDDQSRSLADLRIEYILSQLAEKRFTAKRATVSVQQLAAYTDQLAADSIHISRSPFSGETIPQ